MTIDDKIRDLSLGKINKTVQSGDSTIGDLVGNILEFDNKVRTRSKANKAVILLEV